MRRKLYEEFDEDIETWKVHKHKFVFRDAYLILVFRTLSHLGRVAQFSVSVLLTLLFMNNCWLSIMYTIISLWNCMRFKSLQFSRGYAVTCGSNSRTCIRLKH